MNSKYEFMKPAVQEIPSLEEANTFKQKKNKQKDDALLKKSKKIKKGKLSSPESDENNWIFMLNRIFLSRFPLFLNLFKSLT